MKKEGSIDCKAHLKSYPDKGRRFGAYSGAYLTPELIPTFEEIADAYQTICHSLQFINELRRIRREFQGRPTPVYHCGHLSKRISSYQVYLKHEDLNHAGAHKLNHCMGKGLLARFMGKRRLIVGTEAGQHGVTLTTAAVFFRLECEIHIGEVDIARQAPNVTRVKILGVKVIPITHGLKTLKEVVDPAFESYVKSCKDSVHRIGPALGPYPLPLMVRNFQSVMGYEARDQFYKMTGMFPDEVCACVEGGDNSTGVFIPFLDDPVGITGVKPLGKREYLGGHATSMKFDEKGVMRGFGNIMLKGENGGPAPAYPIANGLDYPPVGPEHALLHDPGEIKYDTVSSGEATDTFFKLSQHERIVPAIESAHAVAYAMRRAREMRQGAILVCLSDGGDKDIDYVVEYYGHREQFAD